MTTPAISRRTALLSFGAFAALAGCSSSTIRRTRDFTPTFPQTRALMDAFVAEGRLPNAVARIKVGAFAQATLKAGTLAFDDAHPPMSERSSAPTR